MTILDLLEEMYLALTANKVRSSLTILGIVIGIAAVIAMVGLGQGAQASIQASIQSVGSNLVVVIPGAQRGVGVQASAGRGSATTLTSGDASAIASISTVKAVASELTRRYQVAAKGTNTNTSVVGTVPAYLEVRNFFMDQGAFVSDRDVGGVNRVAVLGPTTRDDLFGIGGEAIGQNIRINNVAFRVIGVTLTKGGSGFSNPDDAVYIPITAAQQYLAGDAYVSTISVEAVRADVMSDTQDAITALLLGRHHISNSNNADFSVFNQADIIAAATTVTSTFTALLASIAGISLLVGGIGIMNMMLTTVTERTREIGLRKAIGAKRHDIRLQFVLEAVALTLIGGIVGILLGAFVGWIISRIAGITVQTTLWSVLLAFGVSAFIGVIFGYYPARRASQMNPITALRYE